MSSVFCHQYLCCNEVTEAMIMWNYASQFCVLNLTTVYRNGQILLLCVVGPRFPTNHINETYIWAGKTRNITCHILAEPLPVIEWLHNGQQLVDNQTYRIYIMSKDTNLQVSIHIVALRVITTCHCAMLLQVWFCSSLCHTHANDISVQDLSVIFF